MTTLDLFLHFLKILGAGALVMVAGLAWYAWRDKWDRKRYLDGRRDSEGGEI